MPGQSPLFLRGLLICCNVLTAALYFNLPAGALETQIVASGKPPIRIDRCAAGYGSISTPTGIPFLNATEKDTDLMAAAYDFTNVGGRPINAIRFAFRERDAFGGGPSYAIFVNDWKGNVVPGQSFSGNKAEGYNLTGGEVAKVLCAVVKVRYADGSLWSASRALMATPRNLPASTR